MAWYILWELELLGLYQRGNLDSVIMLEYMYI